MLGNYDTPIGEGCKQTMIQIAANRAQRMKIPHDSWPVNPAAGTVVHFGHSEFTLKDCPGTVVWDFINGEMITRVRAILKEAQTAGADVPAPTPPTPTPEPNPIPLPTGMSLSLMKELFGEAEGYAFDPGGLVSRKWLDVGNKTHTFPALSNVYTEGTHRYFIFSNGLVILHVEGEGVVRTVSGAN